MQQTCEYGRPIGNRRFTAHHIFRDCPLKEHAGSDTHCTYDSRTDAEIEERHKQGRHKSDNDSIHIALNGVATVSMWRK